MPGATDQMLARLQSELEERRAFQDGLVAAANEAGRDLNAARDGTVHPGADP